MPPERYAPGRGGVLERLYTGGGGGVTPAWTPLLLPFQCLRLTAKILLQRLRCEEDLRLIFLGAPSAGDLKGTQGGGGVPAKPPLPLFRPLPPSLPPSLPPPSNTPLPMPSERYAPGTPSCPGTSGWATDLPSKFKGLGICSGSMHCPLLFLFSVYPVVAPAEAKNPNVGESELAGGRGVWAGDVEAAPEVVGWAVGRGCQSGWRGGYCRLQMPLKLVLAVTGTVAGHRLRAVQGHTNQQPLVSGCQSTEQWVLQWDECHPPPERVRRKNRETLSDHQ